MSKIMNQIHKVQLNSEEGSSAEEIFTTSIELFPRSDFWELGHLTSKQCYLGKISFNEGLLSDVQNWWLVYYVPLLNGFMVMSPSLFFPDDGSSDRILVSGIKMYLAGNKSEHLLENDYLYYIDYDLCQESRFVEYVDEALWTDDVHELKLEITLKRVPHPGNILLNPPEAEFHIDEDYNSTEASEAPVSEPGTTNVEKYFLSTRFSDISVKCEGILFPLHRIVIYEKCPAFAELIKPTAEEERGSGDFGVRPSWVVELNGVEKIVFTEFLRFLYTGIVENMSEIGISLYEFAHFYQYEELKDHCESIILDNIDSDNVGGMYAFAKKYGLTKLIGRAADVFMDPYTGLGMLRNIRFYFIIRLLGFCRTFQPLLGLRRMGSDIRFGILTVSDRCFRGEAVDGSGEELVKLVSDIGQVVERKCVPDEIPEIQAVLMEWSDGDKVDVLLTTGGTGFAPRDLTPEATKPLLDREAPGLVIAMMKASLQITPMAMLSRPVAGIRKNTLIVTLPGSSKGAVENFGFIKRQVRHAVDLIRNKLPSVNRQHSLMSMIPDPAHHQSKVDPDNVADRARISKFIPIKVTVAQEIVLEECLSLIAESVDLKSGLGCILAQDVFAKDPLPPFRASIKDGYAVKVAPNMDCLTVKGASTAGVDPNQSTVLEKYCVRISTGAPIPDGADSVVQIEDTQLVEKSENGQEEKVIRILKQPVVGQDIRAIGSDIRENEKVLHKGTRLGPTELGVLASVGCDKFLVYKKPVIAILSTGNELQSPSGPLGVGKIRDSNKTTLESLFIEAGFTTVDLGVAQDTPDEVYRKLRKGLQVADVVVSTGGVSMGERDYLKQVLVADLQAEIHFGSVLMKPGKPTTFATCYFKGFKKLVFGLPGNPVSATVTAHLFVLPACRRLSGWQNVFLPTVKATVDTNLKLDKTRPEYHRAHVSWASSDTGIPIARSTGNQISSRLLSCNTANALIIFPQGTEECSSVKAGDLVNVLMISQF